MISISLKMNQESISKAPELPVKRKRGRPRKDETLQPRPHPPPPPTTTTTIQLPPLAATVLPPVDHSMVGQAVTCIIDGVFDNGYLLSTRLGPDNAILRGIVFQQGHVAPVTPENDVAPHLEICTRSDIPVPPADPRNPECVKQQGEAVQSYQNAPQAESLRLVEQDEVMQVFEVSKDCEKENVESFPGKDSVIPVGNITVMESEQHGNQDMTVMEHDQPVVEPQQHVKEPEELQQESKEQIGEVNNNNTDANQAAAVDLSLSNFSEN